MSVILDIDLDYFALLQQPTRELSGLLTWASHPIDHLVEHHHQVYERWVQMVALGTLDQPHLIIHVDEHHDMFSSRKPVNAGNFIYFALKRWPRCRVIWVIPNPIDRPDMWLTPRAWTAVSQRFACSKKVSLRLPKPDVISVCKSPDFVENSLLTALMRTVAGMAGERSAQHLLSNRGRRSRFPENEEYANLQQ